MKKFIKKLLIREYATYKFWSVFGEKYNLAKDTVIGYIAGLIGLVFLFIIAILSRLKIIIFEGNYKDQRIYILAVIGIISYLLIIKPLDIYIKKNFSKEEIEFEFNKKKYTKKNTLKFFLWNIFSWVFLILFSFVFIKFIMYPIIDYSMQ